MAISQTVKQTISVRSGNARRADIAAPGSLSESPVASMRLFITRSTSIPCRPRLVASVDLTCRSCTAQMRVEDHSNSCSHVRAAPEHGYFAFARFSAATREVVCNPSFGGSPKNYTHFRPHLRVPIQRKLAFIRRLHRCGARQSADLVPEWLRYRVYSTPFAECKRNTRQQV